MQQGRCASPHKAVTRYQLGRAEVQCQRNAGVKSARTEVRRPPGAGRPAHSACWVQTGPLCLPKAGAGHSPPRDAGSTAPGWRGGVAAVRSASPGSQGHSHEPLHETCVVFALCGLAGDSRRWPLLRHPADLREVIMRRVGVMGTVSGRSGCPALPSGEGRACHTTSDGPHLCAVSPSSELFTSFLSLLPERCEHQHARQTTARCQVTRAVKTSSPESRLWARAAVWAASRRSLRWSALRIWGLSRLPHPWGPGLSWLGQETG